MFRPLAKIAPTIHAYSSLDAVLKGEAAGVRERSWGHRAFQIELNAFSLKRNQRETACRPPSRDAPKSPTWQQFSQIQERQDYGPPLASPHLGPAVG
jgi:hypothetical protein